MSVVSLSSPLVAYFATLICIGLLGTTLCSVQTGPAYDRRDPSDVLAHLVTV